MLLRPQTKRILPVKLTLPSLHEGQRQFVLDPARIVVAACGSKTGKTFGMAIWLTRQAWNRYQSVNWWCGPTLRQAKIAWNQICLMLPPGRFRPSRTDFVIELLRRNGDVHSRMEFRSGDHPESLRGEGVHNAVVDEASYWSHDSYVSVWTTLSRTRGNLRVISTPKGRNYFYEEWCKGWRPELRDKFPEYHSYQLPTHVNPHVPRESLEDFKKNMPADVYRQEILAEFLDESAGVFRNIRGCATGQWLERPEPRHNYVMGIDWAKHEDYSVFVIADADSRQVVHIERFNELDWNVQVQRAIQVARFWNNARVLLDSTGVGDVVFDSMRAAYPHVDGYSLFNNQQKVALIQKLQFALERGEITLPADKTHSLAHELIYELEMFGYQMSATGRFIFGAPEGYHDDCVIALSLCNWILDAPALIYRFRNVRGV